MANDIVQSLFGVTPDSYQQVQQDRADAQAMRFAQLDPFQQANYAIGRGAYGLAGAVGGALGGQDPELQRISMRQTIAGQIDFGDPQSILAGARELSKRGDITGAMQAADVARKLESEMAQRDQRRAAGEASSAQAAKDRSDIAEAKRQQGIYAGLNPQPAPAPGTPSITDSVTGTVATPVTPQSAAMGAAILPAGEAAPVPVPAPVPVRARPTLEQDIASLEKQQVALLSLNKIPAAKAQADVLGEQIKDLRSQLKPTEIAILEREIARFQAEGIPDTDPRIVSRLSKIAKLVGGTSERFGVDREAIAVQEFNKPFSKLTQAEAKAVNNIVQANKKATATNITNVMPGDKALADIPSFRAAVQRTIEPQLKTINATDQALQAIEDSLATGNFASYRAAQVQFARAISGAGDLSQRELKAAGADPSLLGGTADYLSSQFTSTPTADTQKKIRNTLEAIRTVATKQARNEVDQQRKVALRSPGYNVDAVTEALTFSELAPRAAAPTPNAVGNDLAAQAAAEIERRAARKAK